jgi:hydrogenase maturation factor
MLPVNRIGNGTLFSLRVQGAAVTTKTSDKNQMADESKIMNTTIVTAEAKARLTEAVKNYTPPAPEKYRALNEVKDSIIALRERKASYETIRAMLHENAGIEVSHQTVARYCREVLDSARPKKSRRSKTPTTEPPASAQTEPATRPAIGQPRSRGPRIYDPKSL